jgi:NAD+ dependent glucose-6-phosphate dehydrogenase
MNKVILITGATGSIGNKLRKHFAAMNGFDLRLLCLNPDKDPGVVTADLAEYDEHWAQVFQQVDAVIHLAGTSSATASWEAVLRLNIDLSLNVLRAAEHHGAWRVIFASSNWVMAGYRFREQPLTTDLAPWPMNPYGTAKLFMERAGRDWVARTGRSFIALRIGHCQHAEGNVPGPHMQNGLWGQQMWVSDRDLCQAIECAVRARDVPFAVLNVMSANPGMRWDIEHTRSVIGYVPKDRHVAVSTPEIEEAERLARLELELVDRLEKISAKW